MSDEGLFLHSGIGLFSLNVVKITDFNPYFNNAVTGIVVYCIDFHLDLAFMIVLCFIWTFFNVWAPGR